jgi:hypothetical protein
MLYLAEFYLAAGASLGEVVARARAVPPGAVPAGSQVTLIQAVFVPSDETCFALYRAQSAAAVCAAGRAAGLEFDRVTRATAAL